MQTLKGQTSDTDPGGGDAPESSGQEVSALGALRRATWRLYRGPSERGRRFRYFLLGFDICTIVYFVITAMLPPRAWVHVIDLAIAVPLIIDLAARYWIATYKIRFVLRPGTFIDLIVIASLIVPLLRSNLAFLRVFRALRLLRSQQLMQDLSERWPYFRRNEEVFRSSINLFVFIFVVSATVYVVEGRTNPGIGTFVDALYFTVTTLTTTGFGDVTLEGTDGRLLSVAIMIIGVALFLRLVRALFQPDKASYECPACGLTRHDRDAVHCKHCGHLVHIQTEGSTP